MEASAGKAGWEVGAAFGSWAVLDYGALSPFHPHSYPLESPWLFLMCKVEVGLEGSFKALFFNAIKMLDGSTSWPTSSLLILLDKTWCRVGGAGLQTEVCRDLNVEGQVVIGLGGVAMLCCLQGTSGPEQASSGGPAQIVSRKGPDTTRQ